MTFEEAEAIVKSITYKPGHVLEFSRIVHMDSAHISIVATVPDVRTPNVLTQISSTECLDFRALYGMGKQDFIGWVKNALTALELHERDEWFKVDGAHVTNPHPEIEKHYQDMRSSMYSYMQAEANSTPYYTYRMDTLAYGTGYAQLAMPSTATDSTFGMFLEEKTEKPKHNKRDVIPERMRPKWKWR